MICNNKKKILIIANNHVGLYQFRSELIEKLLQDYEVCISLPYGKFVDNLTEMGCKFIDTKMERRGTNPISDFLLFSKYVLIIQREKPDIVVTYTIKPNVYGGAACRVLGVPYILNITGLGTAFEKNGMIKKLVVFMYRYSCKNAKMIFFENEYNREVFVENGLASEKQTHRLNGAGVNVEKYNFTVLPENKITTFLFMGRIMAEKGIDELIAAMKKVRIEGYSAKLIVLGEYEEKYEDILKECSEEGWLEYYGYQEIVKPYIDQCDCFVLPSWHEGMANTILESAASGRPVITSNIPGCREAVKDGVSGYLVRAKDVDDLYNTLIKFIKLSYPERKEMGVQGRKYMEKLFDKKMIVKETIDCIEGVL